MKNKKRNLIIIIILSILVVFLTFLVVSKKITNFDNLILLKFSAIRTSFKTKLMILISEFASFYFIFFLAVILILLGISKKEKILVIINTLGIFSLNQILKFIFKRVRPIKFMIINQKGYSFPSGHAMISFSFYILVLFLIKKYIKNNILRCSLECITIMLIILIPISRIYLGVHYFSDVMTGILISAIIWVIEKNYINVGGNDGKSI